MLTILLDNIIFTLLNFWFLLRNPRSVIRRIRELVKAKVYRLDLTAPRRTNSKYLWRKLLDHDPRFPVLTDKLQAKDYIHQLGIRATFPQTLWEGEPQDLPEKYYTADVVIKTSHGWASNIYPARDNLSPTDIDKKIREAMAQRHGLRTDEWAYRHLKPKLFVEELVGHKDDFMELKLYMYGPKAMRIVPIRHMENGKRISAIWHPNADGVPELTDIRTAISPDYIDPAPLPAQTDEALRIATEIGHYFDHMRVDFLLTGGQLYLGEITVYNLSGYEVGGDNINTLSNQHWDLRRSWFLNTPQTGWKAAYARALHRHCTHQAKLHPTLDAAGPLVPEDFKRSLEVAQTFSENTSP